jgi:hypothetical protein
MMTNDCQAVVDGRVVGERRTRRIYSHAVVAAQIATRRLRDEARTASSGEWVPQESRLVALSFHHRLDLAQKAANGSATTRLSLEPCASLRPPS